MPSYKKIVSQLTNGSSSVSADSFRNKHYSGIIQNSQLMCTAVNNTAFHSEIETMKHLKERYQEN